MPKTAEPQTPDTEAWAHAWFLVHELERMGMTKRRIAMLHKWDSAVRLFRQIEQRQLFEQDPRKIDLQIHEALLTTLIGLGQRLHLLIQPLNDAELASSDIKRADLAAYIQELKDTFLGWHDRKSSC